MNWWDTVPTIQTRGKRVMNQPISTNHFKAIWQDIRSLISQAKTTLARNVNTTLVLLYWHIGEKINHEVLSHDRAAYGKQTLQQLAAHLTSEFGEGFDRSNLARMAKLYRTYPDSKIVGTLSQQLSWSQLTLIIAIDDSMKRDFYAEMCRIESWNVRELRKQINNRLYERTALAKHPTEIIKQQIEKLKTEDTLTPELIFRDPCILSFTGLPPFHSESDLENAILTNITDFIREMGSDFCFVARQKRMSTEDTDRYLDLLFFHRRMRRLIGIELKNEAFQPEHKGQMEWYLNWLDKNERRDGEEHPIGIILCTDKKRTDIEYLYLENSNIHVAQYLLELPPKELFEKRLLDAIEFARIQYESKKITTENLDDPETPSK